MKQQFQVGDKAVYPVHGVAEVVAFEKRDIGGAQTSVYILKIIETGLKIMVPTANAGAVGLRELIARIRAVSRRAGGATPEKSLGKNQAQGPPDRTSLPPCAQSWSCDTSCANLHGEALFRPCMAEP